MNKPSFSRVTRRHALVVGLTLSALVVMAPSFLPVFGALTSLRSAPTTRLQPFPTAAAPTPARALRRQEEQESMQEGGGGANSLDPTRDAAMKDLYKQMKNGAPFSLEEQYVLKKFHKKGTVSTLEADTVVSRVLYLYYVQRQELSDEQEERRATYKSAVISAGRVLADIATSTSPDAVKETEPNDVPIKADSSPTNRFTGRLTGSADVDLYAFQGRVDTPITVAFDGGTTTKARLELIDDTEAPIAATDSGADGLSTMLPHDGTYFVRVSPAPGTSPNGRSEYQLNILQSCAVDTLDQTDPTASLCAVCVPRNHYEAYEFFTAGGPLTVDTCSAVTNFDTYIVVYQLAGGARQCPFVPPTSCLSNVRLAANDDFCDQRSQLTVAPQAGYFYVVVSSLCDKSFGRFGLTVTQGSTTLPCNKASLASNCVSSVDLSVTKTVPATPVAANTNVTYTITVQNTGPDAAASTVLTDVIPSTMNFQSLTAPGGWTCTTPPIGSGGTITCTNPSVPATGASTFTLVLRAGCGVPNGTVSNTVTVSSSGQDLAISNNTATATITTTNAAPTITCPANIAQPATTGQCGATITFAAPTTTDECTPTVVCAPASGAFFPVGTTTVTCTVTDGAGQTASCSFTVAITDTQAPTITCPANVTHANDPNQCGAVITYSAPTVTDNCPNSTVVCTPASGTFFPVGNTSVTCTATDPGGNTASCTFGVTVNDTQAPAITCPANVVTGNTTGQCSATVNYTTPVPTDNCPAVGTVTCVPASGSTFAVGVTTVTCTVVDASANTGTCSFTVTVNDTQPPTITCPANITTGNTTGQCSAVVTYTTPTPVDNCPGATVVCAPASGATFAVGTTTVTCTATDSAANTATCSFTVTVNDTQPPTITCPANITTSNTTGQCSAVVTFTTPTPVDNCPGATVACVPASGSTFPVGTTSVTCTATDAGANTATCSFSVTVNDTQAPTITCPANITLGNTTGQCSAVVNYSAPSVNDNCPGVNAPVCVPASGSTFPVGMTTVTCSVTDAQGNPASCSFSVVVNDTQAPTVTCPANVTQPNDAGQCGAIVNFAAPTTTDNCPGVAVTAVPASGSFFPVGTTTVTATATDGSGNTATCSFTVTVTDTQPPTVTCPANVTTGNTAGQCSAVVTYPAPTVTDNCPGVTVVCTPASGSTFPVGTTSVTCTAMDPGTNTATCSFSVTVNDTEAPTVTCPANVTAGNDPGVCSAVVNFAAPTVNDNCPGAGAATCVPASGSTFPVGTTTVTCSATDAQGNPGSCSFTVTVNDTQPPVVTCPANVTSPNTTGQCGATVSYAAPTATDNCPGVTVTAVPASGSFFPVGVTTVTATATDSGGNTATCTFTVTVTDTQVPTITCPGNISTGTDPTICGAVVTFGLSASDNCPGVVVACVPASGSTFGVGTTSVTCTATDASSNIATCSFSVTVTDTTPPALTCPANVFVLSPIDTTTCTSMPMVVNYPAPTVTDNCPGTLVVTCTPASGSTFPTGVTTVTCMATDATNNTSTCTFTVSVGAGFGACAVDDASGDTFSEVVDAANPQFGYWRYTVAATGQVFCGVAESVSYTPGVSLISSDRNDPHLTMQVNIDYGRHTARVVVIERNGNIQHVLRDRNINDTPPCF